MQQFLQSTRSEMHFLNLLDKITLVMHTTSLDWVDLSFALRSAVKPLQDYRLLIKMVTIIILANMLC